MHIRERVFSNQKEAYTFSRKLISMGDMSVSKPLPVAASNTDTTHWVVRWVSYPNETWGAHYGE